MPYIPSHFDEKHSRDVEFIDAIVDMYNATDKRNVLVENAKWLATNLSEDGWYCDFWYDFEFETKQRLADIIKVDEDGTEYVWGYRGFKLRGDDRDAQKLCPDDSASWSVNPLYAIWFSHRWSHNAKPMLVRAKIPLSKIILTLQREDEILVNVWDDDADFMNYLAQRYKNARCQSHRKFQMPTVRRFEMPDMKLAEMYPEVE